MDTPLAEGTRVGAYALVRELGRGGMATVWEARHVELGKRVALKVLAADIAENLVARERFAREGRAAVRVQHPNVVDVTDVGTHQGVPFLVLELVTGPTLASALGRALPLSRVVSLFLPVVSAMKRAHAAGVVHRDLKPANVFLATDLHGETVPKVGDFGISKILAPGEADLTKEHGVVGTLSYMSPEQVRSAASADARSDQWAIGVMLYQAATGTLPFAGESSTEIMHAILHGEVTPPSSRTTTLPAAFEAIVLRTLARDPRDRFADMHALGAALLELAEGRTWSDWAREFGVASGTLTTEDASIAADDGGATPMPSVKTAGGGAPRAALSVAGALVVLVALGFTVRLVTKSPPRAPVNTSPASISAATASSSAAPSATPSAPAVTSSLPSASASSSVTKRPVAPAPKPSSPPIGANGAPILE